MFEIDINLVYCLAAAWLIELTLGSPRFFPKPPPLAARFIKISADRVICLTESAARRFGRAAGDAKSGGCDGGIGGGNSGAFTGGSGAPRKGVAPSGKRAGIFFAIYIFLFFFILTAVSVDFARRLHIAFYYIINTLIFSWALGARKAADRAAAARTQLGSCGGRPDAIRRIVTDVSRECLGGVCVPTLYASAGILLGIPAALVAAVKALSIMAGVAGIGTGEYVNIGSAAVKMDNAVKFFPARICAIVIPLLSPICGAGFNGVKRGYRATRDAHSARASGNDYTGSNDVWPAAAFAGILGVSLGGEETLNEKYTINGNRAPVFNDIKRATGLLFAFSVILTGICCGLLSYYFISVR